MKARKGTTESKAQRAQRLAKLRASAEAAAADPRFHADPRVAATALKEEAEAAREKANSTEGSANASDER